MIPLLISHHPLPHMSWGIIYTGYLYWSAIILIPICPGVSFVQDTFTDQPSSSSPYVVGYHLYRTPLLISHHPLPHMSWGIIYTGYLYWSAIILFPICRGVSFVQNTFTDQLPSTFRCAPEHHLCTLALFLNLMSGNTIYHHLRNRILLILFLHCHWRNT